MPDSSPPKPVPHPLRLNLAAASAVPRRVVCGSEVAYAELCTRSNFTFLTGASHPHELAVRAKEMGYHALGIADTNSLAGVVRAHVAAKQLDLPLRVGCRLVLYAHDDVQPPVTLVVYPTDVPSYARLCRLLTLGKRRAIKGQCHLTLHDVLDHAPSGTGCGGWVSLLVPPRDIDEERLQQYRALRQSFNSEAFYVAARVPYRHDDHDRLRRHADLAEYLGCPLVATNDVLYHAPERRPLHDVVTCIRHGCTLDAAGFRLQPHAERHLKPPEEMARLFADYPRAIINTVRIAEQAAGFNLDQLRYQYPDEVVPPGRTAMQHLASLVWDAVGEQEGTEARRHEGTEWEPSAINPPFTPPSCLRGSVPPCLPSSPWSLSPSVPRSLPPLQHELNLIHELGYAHYFLTVHDIVRFARSQGILCQGRGAAANSVVCYVLGITSADPSKINMLFERFVSRSRDEPPDIDIDFEHQRREEVIQYLYEKYGRDRAALTAEVITYRGRSAVREVGKTLGLSLDTVDRLAKGIDWWHGGPITPDQLRELHLDPRQPAIRHLARLSLEIQGFPRHLGQHVGGFVLTQNPLCELVPIENAAMQDRTVIEWDKDDIDALGILKVDVLGLGMLTVLGKAFKLLRRHEGTKVRRHEGKNNEPDQDVSGPDRVAEGDAVDAADLSADSADAVRRAVWFNQPDAAGSGISAFQYRGRLWAAEYGRLREVSADGEGIAAGGNDPVRTGNIDADDRSRCNFGRIAGGDRPRPAGPDPKPEPREALTRTDQAPSLRVSHLPPGSSLTSCLRAFVPSCLSGDDPPTYDMICNADTVGVFQIESRAQMSMLPRLRPRCYYDLVIEVAIVRPGPIQGQMVHPYLRRRNGEEPVVYPDEKVKDILGKTLGVPLFQEQAMRLAIECAGFTPDEADALRRAVTGFKHVSAIQAFGEKIIGGMLERGYDREFAERCFTQIQGFSTYGFPESHAASFAILAYASAYLKCHHPAAFTCALLNSQPMGFYAPAQLVQDAQRHGVTVLPVDVGRSGWECSLEEGTKGEAGTAGTKARRHEGGRRRGGREPRGGKPARQGSGHFVPPCLRASVPSTRPQPRHRAP